MAYFDDPVAEALAPITDASPEELAEYVRAIASTRPNISVEYISNLLLQDGLVNVQGQELTSYISRALDRILGNNTNKVSASSSSVHPSTSTHPSSSSSQRTPTSYPKKRDREEPPRRHQFQERSAGGSWQQSVRDSYPSSSSRYGMNQSTTSSTVNRQSSTSMNSSNGGGTGGNTTRSRNGPPHNKTRSTATPSFNGGGLHPHHHDYSSIATTAASQKYNNVQPNSNMEEQRRTSPSTSSFKQHQAHTNLRHSQKRNDQYATIAAPPPPPPPPPLPIEEQRTLKLTRVPKSITMVQLSHYFEQHNSTIVSMKLVASSSDPQQRQQQQQQQLDPLYHTYVVQCGSHDQAKTILQSSPVLGYPCIHITLHPTNLEEGLPETPRPHPSYKPHHQPSKINPTAAVTVTPLNLESEQQQQQLLHQEQISSISKTLELKHQQGILLQKQLEMQQKILQKVSDSTEKKSKVLKEILQLQKRLVALRQEILEHQNALATTTAIHPQQEQHSSSPSKRFRLDRRTKILKVTGYPLELTTLETLTKHFSTYGQIESITFMENEENVVQQQEEINTLVPSMALVTFDTRGSAENAKANGSSLIISDSTTPVELTMCWHKEPTTTTTTTTCTVNTRKKDDDTVIDITPRNMVDDTAKNDSLVDDAIVDYEEDEDEGWE